MPDEGAWTAGELQNALCCAVILQRAGHFTHLRALDVSERMYVIWFLFSFLGVCARAPCWCGQVLLQDAVIAVTLMEASMQGTALIGACSPLHSSFPADPDADYARQEKAVLAKLGLSALASDGRSRADDSRPPAPLQRQPSRAASQPVSQESQPWLEPGTDMVEHDAISSGK